MDPSAALIRGMEPSVIETPTGYLAISPKMAPINIAVAEVSSEAAKASFRRSAEAWARLHESPDPDWAV